MRRSRNSGSYRVPMMDAGSVIRWRTRLGKSAMAGLASGLRGNDMNLRSRKAALSIVLGVVAPTVGASDAMAWDGKTYVLSVRDMEIVQDINTDDAWSPAADLVVRIARTDPEVRGDIQRLEDENDRLEARYQKVNYAYFHFLAASRKSPTSRVESLTDAQIRVRLRKYARKARTLSKEIKATKTQVASLRGLILGSSAKIETPGHVVDFGDRDVIRVYPDDEIEVSVWDDDVFNDDLYGRATVTLDRATLGHGSLDVSMPNIKFVRLKFRRDESATVPE